ncbi:MAG: ribosome silencing factor, partial [Propionibacteriaceae bacterium]|nr:ribosome silencing factor [Propionibacteriaceae bacterium]
DVFLVITASNERQLGAIVDNIEETLLQHGHKPIRREGERERLWVLLDYSDVVIHIQQPTERNNYALERLWKDCPQLPLDIPADLTPAD